MTDREPLPEALRERLLNGMVDELIAGKRGEAEILGSGGVLGELTRRLVERALSEELSEHLGYPAGHAPPGGAGNSRNGGTTGRRAKSSACCWRRTTSRTLHATRGHVLDAAYAAHPERFVRQPPVPPEPPTAAWINKPKEVAAHNFEREASHRT